MKPDRAKNPHLAKSWDSYGHQISWNELTDIKVAPHGFAVLAWREEGPAGRNTEMNYATLSLVGGTWEMQNDSHEAVPLAKWRTMYVPADCDEVFFRGED